MSSNPKFQNEPTQTMNQTMKRTYSTPALRVHDLAAEQLICESLEPGGTTGGSGVTSGGAKRRYDDDLWDDEEY